MYKSWKGYLTVEASFIMPIVLVIYLLIILCGFYLYNRCVISQDNYLLAFRGSRFTEAGENYGEVIYGDMQMTKPDRKYLESRRDYKLQFYPLFDPDIKEIEAAADMITIKTAGYRGTLALIKKAERLNILEIVERTRK